ncbi:PucR family transcriptional regulator [Nocardioides litoris]|uniref:PucR family transcriptional regulator n=1 Tax=Nocardioides litoris TaxID=1926648 RepID=UPI00111EA9EC|nr:helix-turn-helix domain-containing protein [Nocardioides litoris]
MRAATLEFLARHRRERLAPIADRLVASIQLENPAYALDVVTSADLRHSCVTNVDRILELLAEAVSSGVRPRHSDHDPAYDAARATGRRRAEQGMPLDHVLRSFRMGGRHVWEDLIEWGADLLDAGELRDIGTQLWEVVDVTSAEVASSYHAHERAVVRADEQQRAELWEGLLGGRARDPRFAHGAAMSLDLAVDGDLLVVAAAHLDRWLADDQLAPHATAWVERTEGVVGLVALRDDDPAEALAALRGLVARVRTPIGVSSVAHGLVGVPEGLREATLALRAQGRRPGLAPFDDRVPEALLLSAPEMAALLVDRWLRPVLALPGPEARALVDTLEAWVAAGGSTTATASAVHCHRNTVINRLRRITEVTGRAFTEARPPVELDLALRAHRMGMAHPPG